MNKNRRLFLKGVLSSSATGVLLSSSGLVQAAMQLSDEAGLSKQSSVTLFTNNVKVEATFGEGIKLALPTDTKFNMVRTNHMGVLTQFNQLLNKGESTRLIGMVDDATAELLVAQARHAGARVSWLGQHMSNTEQSRHQIINSGQTKDALLSLDSQLKKSSTNFELESEQPFITADNVKESRKNAVNSLSHVDKTDQWATHLGHALAAPKGKLNTAVIAENTECLEGQFFSFVIEV